MIVCGSYFDNNMLRVPIIRWLTMPLLSLFHTIIVVTPGDVTQPTPKPDTTTYSALPYPTEDVPVPKARPNVE